MACQHALKSLSSDDLAKVKLWCRKQELSDECLYLAAWSYTLSVYSAASEIAAGLIQKPQDGDAVQISSTSSLINSDMTIIETVMSVHINMTEITKSTLSVQDFGNQLSVQLHDNATVVGVVGNEKSRDTCQQFVAHFEEATGGPIRMCIIIDEAEFSLQCWPDDVPSYSPETFLETFVTIVQCFTTVPSDTCLKNLELLGPLNRSKLSDESMVDFNSSRCCIHDFVDQHACRFPDKEAIVSMDGPSFTYRQLSTLSAELAKHLIQNGIKRGHVVPILFDKSPFAILSVVAILKAGGAYVGFSAESPVNFLRECAMIADVPLILTSPSHQGLVKHIGRRPLVVDTKLIDSFNNQATDFISPAQPSDLAYLVFTSGSTGKPKAVMTEHSAYVTCGLAQAEFALLNEHCRVLQFASFNFDATNWEIFTTLIAGATLCVPTEYGRINCLAETIKYLGVNHMGTTPTLAKILEPEDVPELKVLCLWGEPGSQEVIDHWSAVVDVINVYGPSEASMAFSVNIYTRQSPRANNIGPALKDVCAGYVVNVSNHEQLLPVGAQGELVIQGPILGRGYLAEPEKTAQAFIESPVWLPKSTAPEFRRVYKTGDLVRQLPDQSFEIFCRIDKQVKLNGQRMELGEIEYKVSQVLGKNYTVAVETLKLPWASKDAAKVLIAFYSSNGGRHEGPTQDLLDADCVSRNVRDLTQRLLRDLKPIAIPKAFIPLRTLPVTTQGKLDRKTLQAFGCQLDETTFAKYADEAGSGKPVEGDLEKTVQELFAQSLGVELNKIFCDSNFFSLGGDSIKAMKLVSLARKQNCQLSVPDVLQNPKLQDMASMLEMSGRYKRSSYIPFQTMGNRDDTHELLATATRATALNSAEDIEDIIQATDYQASCVAWATLQKRGAINWLVCDFSRPQDVKNVESLCRALVARHAILRTGFVMHRRALYQVVSTLFQPFIRTHLNVESVGDHTDKLVKEDQARKVNIAQPQTAFDLLSHGNQVERLLIRVSHTQYDGASLQILAQEIKQLLHGHTDSLEGTFAGYLGLSREMEGKPGLEYWRSLLAGADMTEIVAHKAAIFLDPADSSIVKTIPTRILSPSKSFSKATSVKAAWALTLSHMTGRGDIVFGSTVWGRNAPVSFVDNVLGSTLSHIPTRAQLQLCPRHVDLMQQLQSQHIQSMRFESLGANTIVETCTDWKRWTRFSSLVVFQGLEVEGSNVKDRLASAEATSVAIQEIIQPADRTDLLLHVEPYGEETRVILRYSKRKISSEIATSMVESFLRHLEATTQRPDSFINVEVSGLAILPTHPGSCQQALNRTAGDYGPVGGSIDGHIETLVEAAWAKVLDLDAEQVRGCRVSKQSFLEIWGNLVSAACLAEEYTASGFSISTEDMLHTQSLKDQVTLLQSLRH